MNANATHTHSHGLKFGHWGGKTGQDINRRRIRLGLSLVISQMARLNTEYIIPYGASNTRVYSLRLTGPPPGPRPCASAAASPRA